MCEQFSAHRTVTAAETIMPSACLLALQPLVEARTLGRIASVRILASQER